MICSVNTFDDAILMQSFGHDVLIYLLFVIKENTYI